jgi:hypothetical protein
MVDALLEEIAIWEKEPKNGRRDDDGNGRKRLQLV